MENTTEHASPRYLNKEILRLAVPNILSNLAVPMLSAVDTALVGHLEGLAFIGAIAIGTMVFNFIYWGFGFLRMGTTGLTAQVYGKKDTKEMMGILFRAMIVAFTLAFLLLIFQYPLADLSFMIVEASPEVEKYAREYFHIRIWAAPATLGLYVIQGWFLGMQNAKYPLWLAIFANGLNILFSVYLVKFAGFHSNGVAMGTVIAQYGGFAFAALLFVLRYKKLLPSLDWRSSLQAQKFYRFLDLNFDIFVRTIMLVFVFSFFTAKSSGYGEDILAANTILMQLWTIMAYGIDGFAYAAESIVGKYVGAGRGHLIRSVVKYLFLWSFGMGCLFSATYWLADRQLLGIFTDKNDIIDLAMDFMPYTIAAPLVNGFCFIWDGIFLGATDSRGLRNSMVFCTLAIFLPTYYLLESPLGNHSLWLAMTIFMVFRGLTLTWLAGRRMRGWFA